MAKARTRSEPGQQPPDVEALDATRVGDETAKVEAGLKIPASDGQPQEAENGFLLPRPRFDARDAQVMTRAHLDSIGLESEMTRAIEEIKQAAGRGENRMNFQCKPDLSCYELLAKELRLLYFEVAGPYDGRIPSLSISWPK